MTAIYAIGDIHGDVRAFVSILKKIGCIQVENQRENIPGRWKKYSPDTYHEWLKCNEEKKKNKISVVTNSLFWEQWDCNYKISLDGKEKCDPPRRAIKDYLALISFDETFEGKVILLGDLVDAVRKRPVGRKRKGADPRVVEYDKDTGINLLAEHYLIDTVTRLVHESQGKFIWLLGNHEMFNVVPIDKMLCHKYTHPNNCDGDNPKKTRATHLLDKLLEANASVFHLEKGVIFCHGGLSLTFMQAMQKKLVSKFGNKEYSTHDTIKYVNTTYRSILNSIKGIGYEYFQKTRWYFQKHPREFTTVYPLNLENPLVADKRYEKQGKKIATEYKDIQNQTKYTFVLKCYPYLAEIPIDAFRNPLWYRPFSKSGGDPFFDEDVRIQVVGHTAYENIQKISSLGRDLEKFEEPTTEGVPLYNNTVVTVDTMISRAFHDTKQKKFLPILKIYWEQEGQETKLKMNVM